MKNPIKDEKSEAHVDRGGSWGSIPKRVRASFRGGNFPSYQFYNLGFRLVKNIPKRRNEKSDK